MEAIAGLAPLIAPIGKIVSAGAGLFENYKQQQYQDKLRDLSQNPAKLNAFAQQFVQPLNAGLVKGTENMAQGYAAERGLAESPALSEEIVAQALGPYIQQNQQQGYQNALQALGLGGGANPQNTGNIFSSLFAGLNSLPDLPPLPRRANPRTSPLRPRIPPPCPRFRTSP